jgi:FOG: LysM repeat
MSVNFKKQNIKVNDKVYQDFAQVKVENDIIVNEGKPDVLKIIQIDTRAFVNRTEISVGKAVISGTVALNILYICDREGESLKCLCENVPFEHTVENPKIKEGMTAHVSVEVSRIDFELLNSRKIRLKILMGLDTTINADREFGLIYDVEDDENKLQIKTQSVRVYTLSSKQNKTFDVQEELILPDSKPSIRDVLKVNAKLTEKDLKIATGKAVVQGMLDVCTLYTNDSNGGVEFCRHDVPFTEVFDISKVPEGADCEIDVAVDDIKWTPKFDSDGNIRKVAVTISLSSVANVSENIDVTLITDCYAPCCSCNVKRESYDFDEFLGESKAQNVVKELIDIKDGMPAISRIYNVITKPYITSNGIENGKVYLEGCIDTYILYICEDDMSPIFSFKKEINFSHTMDISGIRDNAEINVRCDVANVSYNIMSDKQVEVRAVLDIGVCLTNVTHCNAVQDMEIKQEDRSHRSALLVYFVKSGDTLWKIGKKYGVAMEDIRAANDLPDDGALKEGMFLLIPHVRKYQVASE